MEFQDSLELEISDFLETVINNSKPLVSGFDGLQAVHIAEAILHSLGENKVVKL